MQEQLRKTFHKQIIGLLGSAGTIIQLEIGDGKSDKTMLPGLEFAVVENTIAFAEMINNVAFAFSVYTFDGRQPPVLHAEFEEIKSKHSSFNKSVTSSSEKLNKALIGAKQQSEQAKSYFDARTKQIIQELEELKERVYEFEKQTVERLKLSGLSKLWKNKAKQHKVAHTAMSVVLFIAFLFLLQLLINAFSPSWINTVVDTFAMKEKPGNWQELFAGLVPRIVAFGLPVAGVVWLARVFLRSFLSNKLLGEDAEQRSVMLDTYLTLYQEEEGTETDRH